MPSAFSLYSESALWGVLAVAVKSWGMVKPRDENATQKIAAYVCASQTLLCQRLSQAECHRFSQRWGVACPATCLALDEIVGGSCDLRRARLHDTDTGSSLPVSGSLGHSGSHFRL